jgi:hypothetical protein
MGRSRATGSFRCNPSLTKAQHPIREVLCRPRCLHGDSQEIERHGRGLGRRYAHGIFLSRHDGLSTFGVCSLEYFLDFLFREAVMVAETDAPSNLPAQSFHGFFKAIGSGYGAEDMDRFSTDEIELFSLPGKESLKIEWLVNCLDDLGLRLEFSESGPERFRINTGCLCQHKTIGSSEGPQRFPKDSAREKASVPERIRAIN